MNNKFFCKLSHTVNVAGCTIKINNLFLVAPMIQIIICTRLIKKVVVVMILLFSNFIKSIVHMQFVGKRAGPKKYCCLSIYTAILVSAKPVLYFGKSQPASTTIFNNNTYCSVLERHQGNSVALNVYYCLLQAKTRGFKNVKTINNNLNIINNKTMNYIFHRDIK